MGLSALATVVSDGCFGETRLESVEALRDWSGSRGGETEKERASRMKVAMLGLGSGCVGRYTETSGSRDRAACRQMDVSCR